MNHPVSATSFVDHRIRYRGSANQDSSFFGDVNSIMCELIKAIRLQITRIHQVAGRERKKCPSLRPFRPFSEGFVAAPRCFFLRIKAKCRTMVGLRNRGGARIDDRAGCYVYRW